MSYNQKLLIMFGLVLVVAYFFYNSDSIGNPHYTVYMDLEGKKRVVMELNRGAAPNHVSNFKKLIRLGYYNGKVFHRSDSHLVAGGSPAGDGRSTGSRTLSPEISDVTPVRGIIGMGAPPNSAHSAGKKGSDMVQFFILRNDASSMKGDYTFFGIVTKGMEHIDTIPWGEKFDNLKKKPKIIKMVIAADLE